MSDFTKKFKLLKDIEHLANIRTESLRLEIRDGVGSVHRVYSNDVFPYIKIVQENIEIELYFDKNDRDGNHDLYNDGDQYSLFKIPYFKDMIFGDDSMFILRDDYKIAKFIKLLSIKDLEMFKNKLREN